MSGLPITKICPECGDNFAAKSKLAIYCKRACNEKARRGRKKVPCSGFEGVSCPVSGTTTSTSGKCTSCRSLTGYGATRLGQQVYALIKRAGTIETFPDIDSLYQYEMLCVLRTSANSVKDGKPQCEMSINHRVPLNPRCKLFVGMTCRDNLFIGLQSDNATYGNETPSVDGWRQFKIAKDSLNPDWLVNKETTPTEITMMLWSRFSMDYMIFASYQSRPKRNKGEIPYDLTTSGISLSEIQESELRALMPYSIAKALIEWMRDSISDTKLKDIKYSEAAWDEVGFWYDDVSWVDPEGFHWPACAQKTLDNVRLERARHVQMYLQSGSEFDIPYFEV